MKLYEYRCEFHRLNRDVPMALYVPKERDVQSQIAVLMMHRSRADYMSHPLAKQFAMHGIIAAGANPRHTDVGGWMLDYQEAVRFLKSYPGVKKVVLLGHSQAGNYMSCYQYIAENGSQYLDLADIS